MFLQVKHFQVRAVSSSGHYTIRVCTSYAARFSLKSSSTHFPRIRTSTTSVNWFALIGAIGKNETTAFPIGDTLQNWRATGMGEVTCFANDVWVAYFNNHRSITLTVTRIK